MSNRNRSIVASAVVVTVAVLAGMLYWVFSGSSSAQSADPRAALFNNGTLHYDPSSSAAPTPSATVTPKPSPRPVTAKPKPARADGEAIIIGALSFVLPQGYALNDRTTDYAVFVGPDQAVVNGKRMYQPLLRLSSSGMYDMPDDLATLMEGECPFGDGGAVLEHQEGVTTMLGVPMHLTRDTYACDNETFTYATWSANDGNGNRFDADYFFIGDRRPSELTEAFKDAHRLD